MKAWKITDIHRESWLLIFAHSRNRAKYIALHAGLWEYWEYMYIRATRAPEFDNIFDTEKIVECNSDLPEGSPKFYREVI